ncbi:hypothetical protein [Thiosulfativibrio zosterae]|uniref:Uncharacterized protein n=1 Tax=Thiosulfativibrio zosterae TaxID=2675053 RepID=A0A6F8PJV3_9GAMM|nr:hypothetical protein [Thiosulfativibrio zosterae]BBP42337.1 hypothetical protein THMIRHAT_00830 [Thiosulfativibrio zosterae]
MSDSTPFSTFEDINSQQQTILRTWLLDRLPQIQATLLNLKPQESSEQILTQLEAIKPWVALLDNWSPTYGQLLLKIVKSPSAVNLDNLEGFLLNAIHQIAQLKSAQVLDPDLKPIVDELAQLLTQLTFKAIDMLFALAIALETPTQTEPLNLQVSAADSTQLQALINRYQQQQLQKAPLFQWITALKKNAVAILLVVLALLLWASFS